MQLFLPWQSPNTFAFALGLRKDSEKFSEKNLPKRFGGFKKGFYLCTTFRSAKAADGTAEGDLPKRTEIVLYSNISNSVL
jgi:ribosomal protein S6